MKIYLVQHGQAGAEKRGPGPATGRSRAAGDSYWHSPQTKVLEFLLATLARLEHLQDISLAAHPLDQGRVVAEPWGQPGWADYPGVSRTLSALSRVNSNPSHRKFQSSSKTIMLKCVPRQGNAKGAQ